LEGLPTIRRSHHRISKLTGARLRRRRLILLLAVLVVVSPLLARIYVHCAAGAPIYEKVSDVPHTRVALVLGAWVRPNGTLSQVLADRVDAGIVLYKAGVVDKLLMSGDNRVSHYNEPRRMCEYAIKHGVPADHIAMDFAGRRTYDSMYRAKHIFGVSEMVVVTQRFHLDRSLFLCKHVGIPAVGFAADVKGHENTRAETRELGACMGAIADVYLHRPRPVMGRKEPL
jgi:SanA protein